MEISLNKPFEPSGKHIHIICFDVPYPVDYGGVFDLYHKIVALYRLGVKIHLHCFEYGRGKQTALEAFCEEVLYYPRKTGIAGLKFGLPYLVSSRISEDLLERLLMDDYPVLMEGIHCSWVAFNNQLSTNRCLIRTTNVEWKYYRQLANTSPLGFKKGYFFFESLFLKWYEAKLVGKAPVLTLTQKDCDEMVAEFGYSDIEFLPLFLPAYERVFKEGVGAYCLYHGNLSVAENEKAACWLIEEVFAGLEIPLVIAGKNPSDKLNKLISTKPNIRLVAIPAEGEMNELIRGAQLHVLPSFNQTGIKLKLLNALFMGRHCLVNEAGVDGSGLDSLCIVCAMASTMREKIVEYYKKPFYKTDFEKRGEWLKSRFNNEVNAKRLLQWMFERGGVLNMK